VGQAILRSNCRAGKCTLLQRAELPGALGAGPRPTAQSPSERAGRAFNLAGINLVLLCRCGSDCFARGCALRGKTHHCPLLGPRSFGVIDVILLIGRGICSMLGAPAPTADRLPLINAGGNPSCWPCYAQVGLPGSRAGPVALASLLRLMAAPCAILRLDCLTGEPPGAGCNTAATAWSCRWLGVQGLPDRCLRLGQPDAGCSICRSDPGGSNPLLDSCCAGQRWTSLLASRPIVLAPV